MALLALSVLAYALVVEGLLFAGLVTAGVLVVTDAVWRRGESERAAVIGGVGLVVTAAFWTARLEFIVPAVVVGLLVYIAWQMTRGQRPIA
jgi:hypothetical protein